MSPIPFDPCHIRRPTQNLGALPVSPDWATLERATLGRLRPSLLASRPDSLDATQAGPALALARHDPLAFGSIEPASDLPSGDRRTLALAFLESLGLPEVGSSRCLVSRGVRASLGWILDYLARSGIQVGIPADVYPAYHALAGQAGVVRLDYAARDQVPGDWFARHPGACLIVCDPLRPWGGQLCASQWDDLVDQARQHRGLLLVDGAGRWALPPALAQHLARDAPVAWMGSLSRDYLLPYCAGALLAPTALAQALAPVARRSTDGPTPWRTARQALVAHAHRPAQVAAAMARSRLRLASLLLERGIAALDPGHGYFLTVEASPQAAWESGVLGMPPALFGQAGPGTVLSSLAFLGAPSHP